MEPPKVYIDTNVFKFSATRLKRLFPRTQTIVWGGRPQEIVVHDLGYRNPNNQISNPELKAEAELLPFLADLGKQGLIKFVMNDETTFESFFLKDLDSETGVFYGAPIEHAPPPIWYARLKFGFGFDPKQEQYRFLSSIDHPRFLEIQKLSGAYQGMNKLNRNQLLDAFFYWCAEHNGCSHFLTLDFKLSKSLLKSKKPITTIPVRPSELLSFLGRMPKGSTE